MSRRYPPSARSDHFRQPLRGLCDHIYSSLQFLLQVRDIHLVRDAIRVADALHIAVLNQFIETPHYGYAWQLQDVRDLTCANGRAHDGTQEDVNADGSIGQAVTGRWLQSNPNIIFSSALAALMAGI
jgi:hypothetical protein